MAAVAPGSKRPEDPHAPVLVGVGLVSQRLDDPGRAREPLALMVEAALAAGAEAPGVLGQVERIAVPVGRWRYRNPGRLVGEAVGVPRATSISALPGVSQQTLISDAVGAIARGEVGAALVVGGEAGHRLARASRTGTELHDTLSTDLADVVLKPEHEMLPGYERELLGDMPVSYCALVDDARRRRHGLSVDQHRDRMARQYAELSAIAARNPHGWRDAPTSAEIVREEGMIAFPYGRHHVSQWSVDQASALLLCSVATARAAGVPESGWVHPHAFTEANNMVNITARTDLHRSPGAELAGQAVLDAAGCRVGELDLVELYSCFPVAVALYAEALGLAPDGPHCFTGGMPFAGGPFNNFVLHATAQLAQELRCRPGARGLVTTVSGVITKQGFAVWGAEPAVAGYRFRDLTAETAAATATSPVDPDASGTATVVAATVLAATAARPERAVVVVDLPGGTRSIAGSVEPAVVGATKAGGLDRRAVHLPGDHTFVVTA